MKRSISVTSINSSDSVIPLDVIEPCPPSTTNQRGNTNINANNSTKCTIQTRSKSAIIHNNSNNSNTSLNNSLNNTTTNPLSSQSVQMHNQSIKQRSPSPISSIYVDSEETNLSEGTLNGFNNKNEVFNINI